MDLREEELSVECLQNPDDSAMLRVVGDGLFLHVIENGAYNTVELSQGTAMQLAEALINWVNEQ